jgi:hypothetical protein
MKEVARIWIDIERVIFQSEEAFVHSLCTFPTHYELASIPAVILSLFLDLESLDSRPAQDDNLGPISAQVASCAT